MSGSGYRIPLLQFDQIPSFQRKNPYIRNGYRSLLSHHLCIQSAFCWTNETLNIWTHFSGFGFFILLLFYDLIFTLHKLDVTTFDLIILGLTILSFQFCLISSALYHTFCCHSEDAYERWLFLDILGVSISMTFIFISGINFAFHCYPAWHAFYTITVIALLGIILIMMVHPRYAKDSHFWIRLTILITWALYGIIPILHWVVLKGGLGAMIIQEMLPRIIVMYVFGGLGFLIYLTKYPERLWPGKLDYIGSSHQLWHLTVVFGFYWWHNTGIIFTQLRQFDKC